MSRSRLREYESAPRVNAGHLLNLGSRHCQHDSGRMVADSSLQPFRLAAVHPSVLRLPAVVSLLSDPMLSA